MTDDPDDDILMIIAYLRKIGTVPPSDAPGGNVGQRRAPVHRAVRELPSGRRQRRTHRAGPDARRHLAIALGAGSRDSDAVRVDPAGVRNRQLVTKDGQRIRGVKKNEDVFSIQVMDTRERIQGYLKSDLKELVYEKTSLMPAFPARPAERQRSERSDRLSGHAARGGSQSDERQFSPEEALCAHF